MSYEERVSGALQSSSIIVEALKQGLVENGLIEGKGYVLDVRWAEGEYGRFPALATDAVKQNSDLILATTASVKATASDDMESPLTRTDSPPASRYGSPLREPGLLFL